MLQLERHPKIFLLERDPNHYTRTPWRIKRRKQRQRWILAVVHRPSLQLIRDAWIWCGSIYSCFIARWALAVSWVLIPHITAILHGTSLSGCALLNAKGRAQTTSMKSNVRDRKHFLLDNTPCSALASAQLLRNWGERRPSNQGDCVSSATGETRCAYHREADLFLVSFMNHSTWLLSCVQGKWGNELPKWQSNNAGIRNT
jgi:hypothetical protein